MALVEAQIRLLQTASNSLRNVLFKQLLIRDIQLVRPEFEFPLPELHLPLYCVRFLTRFLTNQTRLRGSKDMFKRSLAPFLNMDAQSFANTSLASSLAKVVDAALQKGENRRL